MNQKKYIDRRWFVLLLLPLCLFSCTKNFKDYNTNPNALPIEFINRDNVYLGGFFKKMQESVLAVGGTGTNAANAYQRINNLCGDIYGGYHGMTHNWNAAGDQTTYNFTAVSWNGVAFNSFYTDIVRNSDTINKYAVNNPDVKALAKIIKVEAAHRIVDMYGPIPYFKTGTTLGTFGSPYDPMDVIYYSFFKDLDTAVTTLKQYAALGAKPMANFDAVYGGDYRLWIKFANSLKLRLAMRIAYVDPDKAKQYAEEAVNNEFGIITENSANAVIGGSGNIKYRNPLDILSNAYDETRMSANMESFLKGYKDPRLALWFEAATIAGDTVSTYRGIRNGNIIADGSKYIPFSKLKTDFQLTWLSASEVYFLRAEGALRGWNMGGAAQQLYESGVTKSFEQWGASGATAYLANSSNTPTEYSDPINSDNNVAATSGLLSTMTIKWNDADNFEKKLERILTQKWIAVYPNGQEAWSEYRRTGYPKLFGIKRNQGNDGRLSEAYPIKRLPYPASEYIQNAVNVTKGVQLLGGTDLGGTKLWWDKK
ncbi:hypothetical protein BWD42_07580 [Sphingobacterium sp. CZ-UAM]|uniref:SusD/RagB family nutrient-binding outer membrane lipoprotein n=1 Tax=Sphingobacterium sp. CZ-UAM TaxID=1933868 RepID=UPI00098564E1|nr:SusD/RagB family nutrient-binding outer membrane lipoprotein [Sphingobacterium sp. CZ-UAM]OOG19753.1 hypothetical protein BWD42_07580 [Sphingobacterium sp. CZ-UAM]